MPDCERQDLPQIQRLAQKKSASLGLRHNPGTDRAQNQLLLGYFIGQQQEAKKREQWAEILFRRAEEWLTERGRLQVPSSRAWSTPVRRLNKPPERERSTVPIKSVSPGNPASFFGHSVNSEVIGGRVKNSRKAKRSQKIRGWPFSEELTEAWQQLEERTRQPCG